MKFSRIQRIDAQGSDDGPTLARRRKSQMEDASKNLLKHIPGESSGFYLISAGALGQSASELGLAVLFFLSFLILVLVRWMAGASFWIFVTSIGAFIIWMSVIEGGYISKVYLSDIEGVWGFIVASFYSIIVTVLASSGRLE